MWNENNSPVGNRLELNVERDRRGSHIIMDIHNKNNNKASIGNFLVHWKS